MNKKLSHAFTMLELIFVIVVMGIIGKFGVEFLAQAYNGFIHSKISSDLQANSSSAVKFIANRLQYRIKDSVIARETDNSFSGLASYSAATAPVLEWVGTDIDGFRGDDNSPYWSGIISLNPADSNITLLTSPNTNTTNINSLINILSGGDSGINDAALYFIDSTSDIVNGYGWDFSTGAFTDQNQTMHPINASGLTGFSPAVGNFSGVAISEYYKLAWTAYAVGIVNYDTTDDKNTGTLTLWYDYQPWNGDTYLTKADGTATKSQTIMENVSTFQFMAIGSLIKIQVCSNSDLLQNENEEYSVCKEKTIY